MDWIILIAAAFAAGVLNTIAAGGTFLTFPALVFAGLRFSLRVSYCEIGNAYTKLRQAGLTRSNRADNKTSR